MCECKDVEVGSYDNQLMLKNWWNGKDVCIDKCLVEEIQSLWNKGIITTGCCCGHNKAEPYINVHEDYENIMEEVFCYEYTINQFGVKGYKPKTR